MRAMHLTHQQGTHEHRQHRPTSHRGQHRTRHRLAALLTAAATAAAGVGVAAVALAPAAHAEPECLWASDDLDGDGASDLVVGAPGSGGRGGSVEIRFSQGAAADRVIRLTGPAGYGSSVTTLRSFDDTYDECYGLLVVGSPDETVDGRARAGAVYVYELGGYPARYVSGHRFTASSPGVPGSAQAGARFGAAVASQAFDADRDQDRIGDSPLWVGSPGQDVGGVRDAGQLTTFAIDGTTIGDHVPKVTGGAVVTLATGGVPGTPSTGAALGTAIAVDGAVALFGAPGQRDGGTTAGAVLVQTVSGIEPVTTTTWRLVGQSSPGVQGSPEAGDRFGASLAVAQAGAWPSVEARVVVGVPGEDVGRVRDAGAAVRGWVRATDPADGPVVVTTPWSMFDQSTTGVAGNPETGDAMGAAVSMVRTPDTIVPVAGVPGEDVGTVKDAGMLVELGGGQGWTQDSPGVPGGVEAGDRFAAALSPVTALDAARLVIGVPGENGGVGGALVQLPRPVFYVGAFESGRYGSAVGP